MAAGKSADIGSLAGKVEFEDKTSVTLDLILGKVNTLEAGFGNLNNTVGNTAAGVLTAEGAWALLNKAWEFSKDIISDLTVEGAGIADVVENFDHLTAAAGRSGEALLTQLREGTHNTISDLELITMANDQMTAGLQLADKEWRQLADGAFALAQSKGEDVSKVMETLNDAMLTGRTRALALYTGKIDLAKAEEELAASLGTEVDLLSEDNKLQAARIGILKAVGAATERLGEQGDGVDEMFAQIGTAATNTWNELSAGVASSEGLNNAFRSTRDALSEAFGGTSQEFVRTTINILGEFGNVAATVLPPVIDLLGKVGEGVGFVFRGLSEDISAGQDIVQKYALMIQGYSAAEAEAMVATTRATLAEKDNAQALLEKADAQAQATAAAQAGGVQDQLTQAILTKNETLLKATAQELKKRKEAQEEIASSSKTWQETVAAMDQTMVESIKNYLEAGVSQSALATAYGLTATQVTAVTKALKDEQETQKLLVKQHEDSIVRWREFNTARVEMSGNATEQLIANIDLWVAHQTEAAKRAKLDTEDFYTWVEARADQMFESEVQHRLESIEGTYAHAQKEMQIAEEKYAFAMEHADQFTSEALEGFRLQAEAARNTAYSWGQSLGTVLDELAGKVQMLNGEWVTMEERAKRQAAGEQLVDQETYDQLTEEERRTVSDQIAATMRNSGGTGRGLGDISGFARQLLRDRQRREAESDWRRRASGGMQDEEMEGVYSDESIMTQARPLGKTRSGNVKVTVAAGAVNMNYPVVKDPVAMKKLGDVVGEAVQRNLRGRGVRMG